MNNSIGVGLATEIVLVDLEPGYCFNQKLYFTS